MLSYRFDYFDGLQSDAAVLIDLRQAPFLDEYLWKLPMEENAALLQGLASPFVECGATLQVFNVIFCEAVLGEIKLRPTARISDSPSYSTYLVTRLVSSQLCSTISLTVAALRDRIRAIAA